MRARRLKGHFVFYPVDGTPPAAFRAEGWQFVLARLWLVFYMIGHPRDAGVVFDWGKR